MPIYEFYCRECHTIYNFFSRRVDTAKIPRCPKCQDVFLTRQMSVFSVIGGGREKDEPADELLCGLDEARLEKAMRQLAAESEHLREDDPKAAAQLMRKITEATGMKMGEGFQEALQRLEAGEDPEKIEEALGDALSAEDLIAAKQGRKKAASGRPRHDETLYDL